MVVGLSEMTTGEAEYVLRVARLLALPLFHKYLAYRMYLPLYRS
jgi:hypothetical protein